MKLRSTVLSGIDKELLKLNKKKSSNQINTWSKDMTYNSYKIIHT